MRFISWTRKPGDPAGTSEHPPSETQARCCLQKCGNGLRNHPFGLRTGPRRRGISWAAFSTSHAHADTHCGPVPQPVVFTAPSPVAKAPICSRTWILLTAPSSMTAVGSPAAPAGSVQLPPRLGCGATCSCHLFGRLRTTRVGTDIKQTDINAMHFPVAGLGEEAQRLKQAQDHAKCGGGGCSHQTFATSRHRFPKAETFDGKVLWEVIEKVGANKVQTLCLNVIATAT